MQCIFLLILSMQNSAVYFLLLLPSMQFATIIFLLLILPSFALFSCPGTEPRFPWRYLHAPREHRQQLAVRLPFRQRGGPSTGGPYHRRTARHCQHGLRGDHTANPATGLLLPGYGARSHVFLPYCPLPPAQRHTLHWWVAHYLILDPPTPPFFFYLSIYSAILVWNIQSTVFIVVRSSWFSSHDLVFSIHHSWFSIQYSGFSIHRLVFIPSSDFSGYLIDKKKSLRNPSVLFYCSVSFI